MEAYRSREDRIKAALAVQLAPARTQNISSKKSLRVQSLTELDLKKIQLSQCDISNIKLNDEAPAGTVTTTAAITGASHPGIPQATRSLVFAKKSASSTRIAPQKFIQSQKLTSNGEKLRPIQHYLQQNSQPNQKQQQQQANLQFNSFDPFLGASSGMPSNTYSTYMQYTQRPPSSSVITTTSNQAHAKNNHSPVQNFLPYLQQLKAFNANSLALIPKIPKKLPLSSSPELSAAPTNSATTNPSSQQNVLLQSAPTSIAIAESQQIPRPKTNQKLINPQSTPSTASTLSSQSTIPISVVARTSSAISKTPQTNNRPISSQLNQIYANGSKTSTVSVQKKYNQQPSMIPNLSSKIQSSPSQNTAYSFKTSRAITTAAATSSSTSDQPTATKKSVMLTDEEKQMYKVKDTAAAAAEFPLPNYKKLSLLGKGGFSLVWLCLDQRTQSQVAIKQISARSNSESSRRELALLRAFYNNDGTIKEPYLSDDRLMYIAEVVEIVTDSEFTWIVFQNGGESLQSCVSSLKGDFIRGFRVYRVEWLPTYYNLLRISSNPPQQSYLKQIIRGVTNALSLISSTKHIHGDVKPDNILISKPIPSSTTTTTTKDGTLELSVKLIDYGSSIYFGETGSFSALTIEYMPPEVIHLLSQPQQTQQQLQSRISLSMIQTLLYRGHLPAIDIWSLGATLLEMLTGVPLWLNYSCTVSYGNKQMMRTGLLAVKNADYTKLLEKQRILVEALPDLMRKSVLPLFDDAAEAESFLDLLVRMLRINPAERITSAEILKHPFLLVETESNKIECNVVNEQQVMIAPQKAVEEEEEVIKRKKSLEIITDEELLLGGDIQIPQTDRKLHEHFARDQLSDLQDDFISPKPEEEEEDSDLGEIIGQFKKVEVISPIKQIQQEVEAEDAESIF